MTNFRIEESVWLGHPRTTVFGFFGEAENLNLLTPPWLSFTILTPLPLEMKLGTVISYRIRLHGMPMRWTSEITEWDPPRAFTDTQVRGPYRLWAHRHVFEEDSGGTLVTDQVRYEVVGGSLVNRLFVARNVRKIFAYRKARLLELYG